MIRKITGFVIYVTAASYIMYLGIESRGTDNDIFLSLLVISLFIYGSAGIHLFKTIRDKKRKPL